MSEAELHFLKQRLYEGRVNKARRGEQFTSAPFGYVRSLTGNRIELDPDEQVQFVARLIFDKFDELGSVGACAPLSEAARHQARLPAQSWAPKRAGSSGDRRVATLTKILHHPYYAGCYAFRVHRWTPPAKARSSGHRRCPGGAVEVGSDAPGHSSCLHHLGASGKPGTPRQQSQFAVDGRRAPRRTVLLSGVIYCGRCGRRMRGRLPCHRNSRVLHLRCGRSGTQNRSARVSPDTTSRRWSPRRSYVHWSRHR